MIIAHQIGRNKAKIINEKMIPQDNPPGIISKIRFALMDLNIFIHLWAVI